MVPALGRASLTDAAPQTIDGDENRGPFKHFYEPVEKVLMVMGSRFRVFFENALGIPYGLDGQFVIAHTRNFTQQNRELNKIRCKSFRSAPGVSASTAYRSANHRGITDRSRSVLIGKELRKRSNNFPWLKAEATVAIVSAPGSGSSRSPTMSWGSVVRKP